MRSLLYYTTLGWYRSLQVRYNLRFARSAMHPFEPPFILQTDYPVHSRLSILLSSRLKANEQEHPEPIHHDPCAKRSLYGANRTPLRLNFRKI